MEFLKLVRRRSFVSEVVYAVLNIGMAIALLAVVRYTEAVWLGASPPRARRGSRPGTSAAPARRRS